MRNTTLSVAAWLLCLTLVLTLAGCQWAARAYERQNGKAVTAVYTGLLDKSVAIVVYADDATTFQYPECREEISAFVAARFRGNVPNIRLLSHKDVINWQNETLNWQALQVKDIGKHFSVDRVLYIELNEFASREPDSDMLLRGRIKASCQVFEVDIPGNQPSWREEIAVYFPDNGPLDATQSSELVVRKRALEMFSENLVNRFYDHRELEKTIKEKM